jgi:hypothetical protein
METEKKKHEKEVLSALSDIFGEPYLSYREADDMNDFDFFSSDGLAALEVTYGMTPQQTSSLPFDDKVKKGRKPDIKMVKGLVWHDEAGYAQLTTLDDYIKAIQNSISVKSSKWEKHKKPQILVYELAIAITQTDLLDTHKDDLSLSLQPFVKGMPFTTLYIITPFSVFRFKKDVFQFFKRNNLLSQ